MRFLQPALIAAALLCAPIILLRALGPVRLSWPKRGTPHENYGDQRFNFFVGWIAIIYMTTWLIYGLLTGAAHASTVVASVYFPGDGIVPKNDYATSSGQRYDPDALKCAAPPGTFPLGTRLYLRHGSNAAEVVVNDFGPFIKGRGLDCTKAVDKALHLGGLGKVHLEVWPPLPVPRKRP